MSKAAFVQLITKFVCEMYDLLEAERINRKTSVDVKPKSLPKAEKAEKKSAPKKTVSTDPLKPSNFEQVKEMLAAGKQAREIATQLSIPITSVYSYKYLITHGKTVSDGHRQRKEKQNANIQLAPVDPEIKEIVRKLELTELDEKAKIAEKVIDEPEPKKVRMVSDVNIWIEKAKAQGKI